MQESVCRVATIIGARPQFIKAAQTSRALASAGIAEEIIHTGQHFDKNMSDVFFQQMGIPKPDFHLGIGGGTHGEMTGRQIEAIEKVLLKNTPDWVIVYGDTNSTLAGMIAATKLHIRVAHVEAGLRSFNRLMPEEINRVLTDHASDLLFAPTPTAVRHLEAEGIKGAKVQMVGDVMFDATLHYKSKAEEPDWGSEAAPKQFVLATIHRAENTDDQSRLSAILDGLATSKLPVVLPVHPRTKKQVESLGLQFPANFRLIPPVGYLEMNWLESHCELVATDSGGVQKEAFFHGKPCLTLRDETEWSELVESGCNRLVGADSEVIGDALLHPPSAPSGQMLYGDGDASEKIAQLLASFGNPSN
ncbi:UDP-N-acetylglucosamine 2-epimerase (non-hydrolyzing) [Roseiconus lacunae]|uniref:non-hydrolyzing UDP-N-acetylglucosamine 2-epimerase n=1 Tax=Roseiconus lacunae TaxID=2605694 RepID=UPI00308EE73D|nr:UDP-N-acetylglucosamine 2-epimerase (non-hydrolyzing) [Stieleria sp. HD01]